MSDVKKNIGTHKPEFKGDPGRAAPISHSFPFVKWNDVLTIRNGKNQKAVESTKGDYPICGSGGEMGRASDFITRGDSVIIGRKGNINNPILMREPFWNVDTAFGLEPNEEQLAVEYLYYFCEWFNFEKLNKAVTIPSLTKADLLEIAMPLPPLSAQKKFTRRIGLLDDLKSLLADLERRLDDLVKSQFVEMFGDPKSNPHGWDIGTIETIAANLDAKRVPITQSDREEGPYPYYGATGAVDSVSGYIFDERLLLVSEDGANLLARTYPIAFSIFGKTWVNNHAHVLKVQNEETQVFLEKLINMMDISEFITGSTQPKLTQKQLNQIPVMLPPMSLQRQFADFVARVDKLGFDVQQQIEKLETLKQSLMQEYFG